MKKLLLAALCVAATLSASAQGTVSFANVGGGVNAPVSGPDGLLGAGFSAQLQLADGTNVGAPDHSWLTVCFLVALEPLMVLLLAHLQTSKLLFLTEVAQFLVRPTLSL